MDVLAWFWIVTGTLIVVMLAVDFIGHVRTPHAPSLKEAGIWSAARRATGQPGPLQLAVEL